MTTWTNTSRGKLKWEAPPPSETSGQAYELEIGDSFLLDIGDGFELTVQSENALTVWSTVEHTKLTWPQTIVEAEYDLEIGSGFELEIGDGFTLLAGTNARNETAWSSIQKTGRS